MEDYPGLYITDVLNEFEARADMKNYCVQSYRVTGHLAERLLGIYYLYVQSFKTKKTGELQIALFKNTMAKEEILPSERAFAYKMKLEALNHQGKKLTTTSVQLEQKSDTKYSRKILSEELGTSEAQIQRFIRLTELIPELLDLVDEKQIALSPAVELSFLNDEQQYAVLDCIECNVATPSHAQAIRLKKMSQEGTLTTDEIEDILSEEKPNQIPKIKFNATRIRNVLPKNIEEKKIEDFVVSAIEFYGKHLQKQKAMER